VKRACPSIGSKAYSTRPEIVPSGASPTTWTRSSCTYATRPDTACGGARRTCSSDCLGEVKRRTKVIGRFPGETSCLTLVLAVLDLYITHATTGIKFTQLERQRLNRIRFDGHEQAIPVEITAA
jgi:hypothetical protein